MQVKDIKDLKKVIELCRQTGVDSIKIDNIEIELGSVPVKKAAKQPPQETPQAANDPFAFENVKIQYQEQAMDDSEAEPVELTEEQLLFYSTSDQPQD